MPMNRRRHSGDGRGLITPAGSPRRRGRVFRATRSTRPAHTRPLDGRDRSARPTHSSRSTCVTTRRFIATSRTCPRRETSSATGDPVDQLQGKGVIYRSGPGTATAVLLAPGPPRLNHGSGSRYPVRRVVNLASGPDTRMMNAVQPQRFRQPPARSGIARTGRSRASRTA